MYQNSEGRTIGLAVFDIDGTLADDKGVFPSAVTALRHIAACGVPVAIATGRNAAELPEEILRAADIRYCIGINGAMTYDLREDRMIASHRLDGDLSRAVFEIVRRYKSGYCVYDENRDLIDEESLRNWDYWRSVNGGYAWIPDEVVPRLQDLIDVCDGTSKICGFAGGAVYTAMRAEAEALPGVFVTQAVEGEIEVMKAGVNKGAAILELCAAEDIDPGTVFCCGDGENDYEMMTVSGIPVCMGNGSEKTKKAASFISTDCWEDGVYNAVMRYFN